MSFLGKVIEAVNDEKASDVFFNSIFNPALLGHGDTEEIFKRFLLRKPVKVALEIGTYNGLSAAFIAQYAEMVITIDVVQNPMRGKIWNALGLKSRDKIIDFVIDNETQKQRIIKQFKFDVAFVDGNHFGEYPRTDFEMVKHCGRVILHDYHKDFPDVVNFVDSLDQNMIEKKGLFVYWENSMAPEVLFPEFNYNLGFVGRYLTGKGLDMGCGCCPLVRDDCRHIDHSPQPKAWDLVDPASVIYGDAVTYVSDELVDYVFSSHMVEDLESKEAIIECLNGWAQNLKVGGHIVLLLPDMQGGRYPTVAEGGNPSHRVDVGMQFFNDIKDELKQLRIVQIDTIPHEKSSTFDVVLEKIN